MRPTHKQPKDKKKILKDFREETGLMRTASDFSTAALRAGRQWVTASKSEGQASPPKLPIKSEGGLAKFCLYKLSKHCANAEHFSGSSWRRHFTRTREKTRRGHWIQPTGTQLGEVKGVPRTPRPRGLGGSNTRSSQSTLECTRIYTKSRYSLLQPKVYK